MREQIGQQIKKYFRPFPKWAVWMIVIGIFLSTIGVGLLMIAIGIWALISWTKRPSDAEMDTWFEQDVRVLHVKALTKTGTDTSDLVAEPVMVTGPRITNRANCELSFRKGKDNIIRFTPVNVTIINFTAHQLVVYGCALDLTTGNALNESTDEYFYNDVVSVSTKTKSFSVQLEGGKTLQLDAAEMFELTTSGGTSVEVFLRDPKVIQMMGGTGDIPTTRAERAIQSVRKMLREKKSALVA
ncbi:MAG: hypothetical protein E6J90_36515 [Deltaproteobacteria bacterium]|nr:MAG: hypothetical protein E6J90_36515 [Deltaproteobacteria bacterium]